jgi:hypothetical protein
MKFIIYTSIIILVLIISFVAYKDYQRRMFIVNANYQCIYGNDSYCNYLIELDMKGNK